ncbi:MAG: hypothetical protein LBD59_01535 [Prevotellaceae bacterium]|jgi:hypothetical protein|nr:hypothetical protein [Prevotellaceae bacterium]
MKKNLLLIFLVLTIQTGYSQDTQIGDTGNGRNFIKRIEPNLLHKAMIINGKTYCSYNLKSKTDIEKLLFGDINAKVEFVITPSFEGSYGMRLVKDSLNTGYLLEIKRIINWAEINSQLEKEFPLIGFGLGQIDTVSKEQEKRAVRHNRAMLVKHDEERLKRYSVARQSIAVKNKFAEKLYGTIFSIIKNFVMKGDPAEIFDGYDATFRCVVDDEVWTLTIQNPDGVIEQLTNICNLIIKDVEANTFNESKHIESLDVMYACNNKNVVQVSLSDILEEKGFVDVSTLSKDQKQGYKKICGLILSKLEFRDGRLKFTATKDEFTSEGISESLL